MKRGVLFDYKLLTEKKTTQDSHPYFEGDVYRYELNYAAPSWVEYGCMMKQIEKSFGGLSPRILCEDRDRQATTNGNACSGNLYHE